MTDNTLFELLQLGHPQLRRKAKPVENIEAPETQEFVDKLLRFVEARHGMGIAAPQVDVDQQIFIMSCKPNARYPYAPTMPPTCVINPVITWRSDRLEKDWEGCLSLPGIRGLVPRYESVAVRYYNRNGEVIETEYEGFIARVFQHEYDHLKGKVFLDRVETTLDIMMEQEWQRQIATSHS